MGPEFKYNLWIRVDGPNSSAAFRAAMCGGGEGVALDGLAGRSWQEDTSVSGQ